MRAELESNKKTVTIKEKEYLEIAKKYEKYFERKDKDIILNQIKRDLRNDFNDIDTKIISNNIFEYCCLVTAKIDIHEISRYIRIKNNYIFDMLLKEEKDFYNYSVGLNKISMIIDKYTRKITPYS